MRIAENKRKNWILFPSDAAILNPNFYKAKFYYSVMDDISVAERWDEAEDLDDPVFDPLLPEVPVVLAVAK